MKKIFYLLTLLMLGVATTGCSYDDSELWSAVGSIDGRLTSLERAVSNANTDIAALQSIVGALQAKVTVDAVTQTENGCKIVFSNGQTAEISNGRDGSNAPVVSVKQHTDGIYYWTLDGEFIIVDGRMLRVTPADGKDGTDGKDGVTPRIRINDATGEWEYSTDDGLTWVSTGVVAAGADGDSYFRDVDTTDDDYVIFTLADGSRIAIPRTVELSVVIERSGDGVEMFGFGKTKTFAVVMKGVADWVLQRPDGWRAELTASELTVTAPAAGNAYAERRGEIAVMAVAANGTGRVVKMAVEASADAYELRILTFEDADAKFPRYEMPIAGNRFSIGTWSDLIDEQQYGGPLLYGEFMNEEPYFWYDRNNTELKHTFPETYGYYCYWSGGHAISNYGDTDVEGTGDYSHQLTVNGRDGAAGHNGSANFAVHFGYIDGSGYNMTANLPALEFGDGVERIIDHMWVMPNNYALNCYANGNSLTPLIRPGDYVKIIATGYDSDGQEAGETTFTLCDGEDTLIMSWTKWDLSVLGKVARVEFNILGTSDNGYGFSQPAYFAYDDVAVRFYE